MTCQEPNCWACAQIRKLVAAAGAPETPSLPSESAATSPFCVDQGLQTQTKHESWSPWACPACLALIRLGRGG